MKQLIFESHRFDPCAEPFRHFDASERNVARIREATLVQWL
jgi:hypothetical protein